MDYILGFLIILVICIYIYVFNNQYVYKINNSFIKNKEELIKNSNKFKNSDKFQDINEIIISSDNETIVDSNIDIKINGEIIDDDEGKQIFYLNDSKDKFSFQIYNLNIIGKLDIIIDGEHKLDHKKIKIDTTNILMDIQNIFKFDVKLNHKVKYNINIVNNLTTGKELITKKKFIIGDKRFNYFGRTISEESYDSQEKSQNILHLIINSSNERTGLYDNDYLINAEMELCQKNIEKIFIESTEKSYINMGNLILEPFNLKTFKITIPDFKLYFNNVISYEPDKQNINEMGTLSNFVPDRIETKLLIVDAENKCEIDFSKNDYVKPQIESDNGTIKIIPSIKNYLINIKFVKSKFYNKNVIYIVKLNLIYKNLINTENNNLLERNAVPLIFCFTIDEETSKKYDLIYKDINFSKNIAYKNKIKNKFITDQLEQDTILNMLDNDLSTQIKNIVNLNE